MNRRGAVAIGEIKKKIIPILKKNKVSRAGIFGSYARGEQSGNSDIDLLIKVEDKKFSLIDLIGIEMELKKAVGKKVDLITYNGINPLIKEAILEEEVRII
jgi:predicted nucleotidyltransferase